jgi:cell division protein ZapA
MSQVTVTIAGHTYRIACGPGEERHLERLASLFDSKIEQMRGSFGEIGDLRLHVMAAITLADELVEARQRIEDLQQEADRLKAGIPSGSSPHPAAEARMAETIEKAAERLERLARGLNPAPQTIPEP